MDLKAKDVMTRELVTVTPATTLTHFARICAEDEISGCPVVTVDGRLVGIASKTDLLERLLEGRHDYSANRDFRGLLGLGEEGLSSMGGTAHDSEEEVFGTVDDIMETEVVTVKPEEPIAAVAKRMALDRVHRVLVVEKGKLKGIITSLDLLAHFPG
jgi:CBS domain-containing protein